MFVKDIDVPSDCDVCWHPTCNLWIQTDIGKRHKDCPISPMPKKHGRLIDAKALDYAFTDLRFNDDRSLRHWDDRKNWCLHGSEVESLIENAETIVEAEV